MSKDRPPERREPTPGTQSGTRSKGRSDDNRSNHPGLEGHDYGAGLGTLPPNPAGAIELADPVLHAGGDAAADSGRAFWIWTPFLYRSSRPECSAYGDNLWLRGLSVG